MSAWTSGTPRPHGCVLLLEDDTSFRQVLVELLEAEGLTVSTCDSYALLCEAARSGPKCVVLADFWGSSHAQLSPSERDQIRHLGRQAPTILLTGRAWAETATPEDLNIVTVSFKPPVLDELVEQIRRCLNLVCRCV